MTLENNAFLQQWDTSLEIPPFEAITTEQFPPAFQRAFNDHQTEIDAIADEPAKPTFQNTIEALEDSGQLLSRVSSVFFALAGTDTNDALQKIQKDVAPTLSRHYSEIYLNQTLFDRVHTLFNTMDTLDLTSEQRRVLERYNTLFERSGASLSLEARLRMKEIASSHAALTTSFAQNVLADEREFMLVLDSRDDLDGLPGFVVESAAAAASERGLEGKFVITLARSSIDPFLTFSARRDLRQTAFEAWTKRGENDGKFDNRDIISQIVALRHEQAELLGFGSFAEFALDDTMAGTPQAVRDLLLAVWAPARAQALIERDQLQDMISSEGGNFDLEAWDWRFYSERVRKQLHDLDETELKPYFQLDQIIQAAFYTAGKLFGLSFEERSDLPRYHKDVRGWEVTNSDGGHVGIFFGDYFARPSKRSGAWMQQLRPQHRCGKDVSPIILNVMNFSKGPDGAPTLLSFDDARTLFHEFGHALHGLLSNVTYPIIAGTKVSRDFVELPSQLFEHWLEQPEVLQQFAVHHVTGAAIPQALLTRLLGAQTFNQGFATVEYVSSALVDLDLHCSDPELLKDAAAFESQSLGRIDMPKEIAMRHRLPHFLHLFSSYAYASSYYSYMWSEVMDADAFGAFEEAGDIFDSATADRLYGEIYSTGGRNDPNDAYIAFRGRPPEIGSLLEKRGLA